MIYLLAISCQTQNDNAIQAVDLGLPSGTKWADRNLGAECPNENGCYYAWGETSEKVAYSWETIGSPASTPNFRQMQRFWSLTPKVRTGQRWTALSVHLSAM